EVQVPGGAIFASRTPRWTLAAVAKRGALPSLMLYDLRAVLGELEGGPPIRRSTSVVTAGDEEHGVEDLPMPELGEGRRSAGARSRAPRASPRAWPRRCAACSASASRASSSTTPPA